MENTRKKELVRRYVARQLSPEELKEFFQLLQQEDGADFMPEVEDLPIRYEAEPGTDVPERILRKEQNLKIRYLSIRNIAATAAAILIIFGGTKAYQYYSWYKLSQTFTTISIPKGMLRKITLADSSRVTLTSGTVFRYPMAFGKSDRRVTLLEGNALFEVTKDPSKPFTVESGSLQTTALGTSFTVQRNSQYGYEKVNLYTGKVRVNSNNNEQVILYPGDEIKYEANRTCGVKHFTAGADPLHGGGLIFEKKPFSEAMYTIASYYGVSLKFNKESFKGKQITGEYNFSDVDQVLQSIGFMYHLKINKIDDQNYSIMQQK
jgi:ferric-dicitrate binding protein FerR (iron transport regulator)